MSNRGSNSPGQPVEPLGEPLTRREREILALLPEDLSASQIAEKLFIAPSSTRWHIQQIYGKLGVNNRRQALQRAIDLGLLDAPAPAPLQAPIQNEAFEPLPASLYPTGTVTFLFTDIEGSVTLWEKYPQAMKETIARHHALLRHAIGAFHGFVFQVVGDAFQAAFSLASQALNAALEAQRLLQAEPWGETRALRVRMGLHTGPAELDENGEYAVSHTLNRASRVMSAGHGGQVLLSVATASLLREHLPPGVTLKDMGEHRLKGMLHPEGIFQALALGLPADFPPLNTETYPHHNLPLQLSSFIGREKEIDQVMQLIHKFRLVTLVGIGGVGKTRLELKVAEEVFGNYPHGVWLASLASYTDPGQVPQAVAQVFGLREQEGRPSEIELVNYLRSKRLLLVLDNCEHLVEACARLAALLLSSCPEVRILASSREALGLPGETQFSVPTLSVPGYGLTGEINALTQYDAIRLFIERAGTDQNSFRLTVETAPHVIQICWRLDGIPLALELAAARVKVLGVAQIAARLDNCFKVLGTGSRTALPRHQTLRAAIDWSYNLLSIPEQLLFRRLSVFNGGWSLEAAEAVCRDDQLPEGYILDLLGLLVMKSLVVTQPGDSGIHRYSMLETIRQYAQEKLVEAGEVEQVHKRHFRYFLETAERNEAELRGKMPFRAFFWLALEHPNLEAALDWASSRGAEQDQTEVKRLARQMHQDYHGWGTHMILRMMSEGKS